MDLFLDLLSSAWFLIKGAFTFTVFAEYPDLRGVYGESEFLVMLGGYALVSLVVGSFGYMWEISNKQGRVELTEDDWAAIGLVSGFWFPFVWALYAMTAWQGFCYVFKRYLAVLRGLSRSPHILRELLTQRKIAAQGRAFQGVEERPELKPVEELINN